MKHQYHTNSSHLFSPRLSLRFIKANSIKANSSSLLICIVDGLLHAGKKPHNTMCNSLISSVYSINDLPGPASSGPVNKDCPERNTGAFGGHHKKDVQYYSIGVIVTSPAKSLSRGLSAQHKKSSVEEEVGVGHIILPKLQSNFITFSRPEFLFFLFPRSEVSIQMRAFFLSTTQTKGYTHIFFISLWDYNVGHVR